MLSRHFGGCSSLAALIYHLGAKGKLNEELDKAAVDATKDLFPKMEGTFSSPLHPASYVPTLIPGN